MLETIKGFGSLKPFEAMVSDVKTAIILLAFFHFADNLTKFTIMRKSIKSHLILVYEIPILISALIRAWIFETVFWPLEV
jgi:hypothetical protein